MRFAEGLVEVANRYQARPSRGIVSFDTYKDRSGEGFVTLNRYQARSGAGLMTLQGLLSGSGTKSGARMGGVFGSEKHTFCKLQGRQQQWQGTFAAYLRPGALQANIHRYIYVYIYIHFTYIHMGRFVTPPETLKTCFLSR